MMNLSIFSSKEFRHFSAAMLKFILLSAVLLAIVSYITSQTVIKTYCNSNNFVLPSDAETLILGDSSLMTGLDPRLYENTYNGSKRAELIPLTYLKFKFIHQNNPQIKTLIITMSCHQLISHGEYLMKSDKRSAYYSDNYFFLYDKETTNATCVWKMPYIISWLKYKLGIPFELNKNLSVYIRILLDEIHYSYYPFWGSYQEMTAVDGGIHTASRIAENYGKTIKGTRKSNIMIDYFERLIKYCNKQGIGLIGVNPPVAADYKAKIPKECQRLVREVTKEMEIKYDNFRYLDYSGKYTDRSLWRDADHMNREGALQFSEDFFRQLEIIIQGD